MQPFFQIHWKSLNQSFSYQYLTPQEQCVNFGQIIGKGNHMNVSAIKY